MRIGAHEIPDIADNPFKFLGRYISKDLSDKSQQESLLKSFDDYMILVDSNFLKGSAKAWIYKHFVMSFISWPLIIYDFPPYIVDKLTSSANRYLKKWLKVYRPVSPEVFYLPEVGLHLPHPRILLKTIQVSKHHILSTSRDPKVRYIHEAKLHKAIKSQGKRWSPESTLLEITETLKFESKFQPKSVLSKAKSSFINFSKAPIKVKRKLISLKLKKIETDKMRVRLLSLCKNGNFTSWENLMASDISWNDMIYELSENVLSFKINAISNCLPSPSNLHRWGLKSEGACSLCNKRRATAAHILSNCFVALVQNRYTWRHDNVLIGIHKDLVGIIQRANRLGLIANSLSDNFVKEGKSIPRKSKNCHSIFMKYGASDWRINFDFHSNPTIPPETLVDTRQRPDIVIFSISKKVLIWFEETVPLERNCADAAIRKEARYSSLKADLMLKDWKVHDFTYEVGALGFIAKTFNSMLGHLGVPSGQRKHIRNRASKLALRSSFFIWSNRFSHTFTPPKLTSSPASTSFPLNLPPPLPSKPKLTTSCLADTFNVISSEISLRRNSRSVPPPKNTSPFTTPAGKSSTTVPVHYPLPSTLSKLRRKLEASTPIDYAKWSNFNSWSNTEQKWFKKHIPLYELECMMGMDPLKNSIRVYLDSTYPVPPKRGGSSCPVTSDECVPPPQPVFSPQSPPADCRPATPDFGTPPDIYYEEDFQNDCAEPPW
ncbi:MAG: hypothetical protein HRT74_12235, partial [Flavobacteriales bacterium]|nr:hypothetical protein [Flavobacteriales bacterium]